MSTQSTLGSARERIPARTELDQKTLKRLTESGALIVDDRRRRPLYFDGRFLAAHDLTREQAYFLTRQSDLGRAGGLGVISGLGVSSDESGRALRIEAGHGVTPSGESVQLPESISARLTDLAETQRLDASFGILEQPGESPLNRTGIFLVALRPVEFTANPIAAYPTSITAERSVEDGDIIEGVVVTLIPYRDPGGSGQDLVGRRASTARSLFVEGSSKGLPIDALPLAMVALERNTVRWLDVFMVRREMGADHGDVLGMGLAPRAVREAHLLQYDRHLKDLMSERDAGGRGLSFSAAEHFQALPPAGRLPVQSIDTRDFTQTYFPPDVQVDLSIVPEDEIPALLEESLMLPPIDLTQSGKALESTSVLILVPRPTERVRALRTSLDTLRLPLPTAAPGLVARRQPLEVLRGLRLARVPTVFRPEPVGDAAWAAEVADAAAGAGGLLWFVRRRNVDYRSDVIGTTVAVTGSENDLDSDMEGTMRDAGLVGRSRTLVDSATTLARPAVVSLLGSPSIASSRVLARAAVAELETARAERPAVEGEEPTGTSELDLRTATMVSSRFSRPGTGDGFSRLTAVEPSVDSRNVARELAESGRVLEIDRVAARVPESELPAMAAELVEARGDATRIDATLARFSPGGVR